MAYKIYMTYMTYKIHNESYRLHIQYSNYNFN